MAKRDIFGKFEVPHPPPPSRARKFYEEKLWFTPKEKYAGRVIYECGGGSWVFMYPSAGARASKAVQRPTATLDTSADVQGKFPRLRFSAYSSLNVDTEK